MRRSAWIFFASIFLPSLGLAWLAVHSVRDQQVVLEHQQAIICQNITDALAKSIQGQMDQVRDDFVKTTQQLLSENSSPQVLAQNFNGKLRDAWPMAEIGFAVNLNGVIYSPEPYDGPAARTFRDENDRFLSNRENVEVYSSNSVVVTQNGQAPQNAVAQVSLKTPVLTFHSTADKAKTLEQSANDLQSRSANVDMLENAAKDESQSEGEKSIAAGSAARAPATTQTERASADAKLATDMSSLDAGKAQLAQSDAADSLTVAPTAAAAAARATPPPPTMPQSAATVSTTTAALPPSATPAATQSEFALTPAAALPNATPPPPGNAPPMAPAEAQSIEAPESGAAPAASLANTTPTSPTDNVAIGGAIDNNAMLKNSENNSNNAGLDGTQNNSTTPNSSANFSNSASLLFGKIQRQVIPQQVFSRDTASLSNTVPEESDFRRVIGTETSGALARFLEDKLRLLVWSHPAADAPIVFGAQLDQAKVVKSLKASFQIPEMQTEPAGFGERTAAQFCVAILNDTGHPVAQSIDGFQADWKHPFVATEIGEVLPHWEAALYLRDPGQISRTARTLQLTFGLIVLMLVAAIVSGGSLIAADVRRQVRLAQQKTDFVSNVSHELKTPLTSIRMFADLLAEKRVPDEERQATYLRIIAAEASRLTRLINNVLDFARLERGAPPGEHHDCDLVDAARDVVETCGPHLEAAGIKFQSEIEAETLPIRGDRDALAQIILNLISNAEKYGGNDVLVRVRRQETAAGALGCVDVLDRGAGIPAKQVRTIFEPFQRLDDSLSSGIPGSGLGLTLARRMARAHGGDVTYSARAGGGSCFTLSVPLAPNSATI